MQKVVIPAINYPIMQVMVEKDESMFLSNNLSLNAFYALFFIKFKYFSKKETKEKWKREKEKKRLL